jgi:hypothetical protein
MMIETSGAVSPPTLASAAWSGTPPKGSDQNVECSLALSTIS